jgi:hypothetical protein
LSRPAGGLLGSILGSLDAWQDAWPLAAVPPNSGPLAVLLQISGPGDTFALIGVAIFSIAIAAIVVGGFILAIILQVRRAALTIMAVFRWERELAAARDLRDGLTPLVHRLNEEVRLAHRLGEVADLSGLTREGRRAAREHANGLRHFRSGVEILSELEPWLTARRRPARLAKARHEFQLARRDLAAASAALDRALGPTAAAGVSAVGLAPAAEVVLWG